MSNPDLKRLAEKVMSDDGLKLGHPAKTLARAVMSMDDPGHFIRSLNSRSDAPVRSPEKNMAFVRHNKSPYRDRSEDGDTDADL